MSWAVEWYGTGLSHWWCHMHELNNWVFVQRSDIVSYFLVIVIFYCANATAFHMTGWKISEGGRWVNLRGKMGRRMWKVENHWFRSMCLVIAGVANQSETKSHISYCVTAKSQIIYMVGTHEHLPIASSLIYILLLS